MKNFNLNDKSPPVFKTPAQYFENFPLRTMDVIESTPSEVVFISHSKRWLYAAAAILVTALGIAAFQFTRNSKDLNADEISNYINEAQFSNEEIANLLEPEDLVNMETIYEIEDNIIEDILSTHSDFEQIIID